MDSMYLFISAVFIYMEVQMDLISNPPRSLDRGP
jgi:hypothetical protein